MNDLISRQVAIDAFLTELTKRERKNLLHTWSTVEVKKGSLYCGVIANDRTTNNL